MEDGRSTLEFMEKVKKVKSAEELLALAKADNMEMTAEQAERYFLYLNPSDGELCDEELDNVFGGGCSTNVNGKKKIVVSSGCKCFTGQFELNYDPALFSHVDTGRVGTMDVPLPNFSYQPLYVKDHAELRMFWSAFAGNNCCGVCCNLAFQGGTGYCTKS